VHLRKRAATCFGPTVYHDNGLEYHYKVDNHKNDNFSIDRNNDDDLEYLCKFGDSDNWNHDDHNGRDRYNIRDNQNENYSLNLDYHHWDREFQHDAVHNL